MCQKISVALHRAVALEIVTACGSSATATPAINLAGGRRGACVWLWSWEEGVVGVVASRAAPRG